MESTPSVAADARLREGLEALITELDRSGNPRRMVSVKDLRELLAATDDGGRK